MLNVNSFRKMKKSGEKIVMLTAYDAATAAIAEKSGVEMLLVGDSMANSVLGYKNTIALSIEESIFHTSAVRRGAPETFIVADMPFMTYQNTMEEALKNAARYLQQCGANAIKIEGGDENIVAVIEKMTSCGIPVVGHIGLLPQKLLTSGTYKVAGRTSEDVERLVAEAKAIEEAGAFALVLECMPEAVAEKITAAVDIPTIGIGAGVVCDGQVQVITDVLGLGSFIPKHAKSYANLNEVISQAIGNYVSEVKDKKFPTEANTF